jgi:hypothetical protein
MPLFGRESESDNRRAQAWAQWVRQRNPYAIASVVLGVFSFIEMGVLIVFGVGGIALGIAALRQLARPDSLQPRGRGLACFGIIISAVSLLMAGAVYLRSHTLD